MGSALGADRGSKAKPINKEAHDIARQAAGGVSINCDIVFEGENLPHQHDRDVPRIIAGLRVGQPFSTIPVPEPPVIRRGVSGTFYDKGLEGASHHAVIPNVNTIDKLPEVWPRLSSDEKKLFDVNARAYLAALMPDFRYRQTTATLDVRGFEFRAAGRQPIDLGWRAAFPEWQPSDEKGDEAQLLGKQLYPVLVVLEERAGMLSAEQLDEELALLGLFAASCHERVGHDIHELRHGVERGLLRSGRGLARNLAEAGRRQRAEHQRDTARSVEEIGQRVADGLLIAVEAAAEVRARRGREIQREVQEGILGVVAQAGLEVRRQVAVYQRAKCAADNSRRQDGPDIRSMSRAENLYAASFGRLAKSRSNISSNTARASAADPSEERAITNDNSLRIASKA